MNPFKSDSTMRPKLTFTNIADRVALECNCSSAVLFHQFHFCLSLIVVGKYNSIQEIDRTLYPISKVIAATLVTREV